MNLTVPGRRRHALVLGLQAAALEQAPHTGADCGEQARDILVAGRRGRVEAEAAWLALCEYPIEHEGVEVG